MMIKCEYVDEFGTVLQQILSNCSGILQKLRQVYERAKVQDQLAPFTRSTQLAVDTHLFFIGLLHMWVKDTRGDQFRYQAIELVRAHMRTGVVRIAREFAAAAAVAQYPHLFLQATFLKGYFLLPSRRRSRLATSLLSCRPVIVD